MKIVRCMLAGLVLGALLPPKPTMADPPPSFVELGASLERRLEENQERLANECAYIGADFYEPGDHLWVRTIGEHEVFLQIGDLVVSDSRAESGPDEQVRLVIERAGRRLEGSTPCMNKAYIPAFEELISALKANDGSRCAAAVGEMTRVIGPTLALLKLQWDCLAQQHWFDQAWAINQAPRIAFNYGLEYLKQNEVAARFSDDPVSFYEALRPEVILQAQWLQQRQASLLAEELVRQYEQRLAGIPRIGLPQKGLADSRNDLERMIDLDEGHQKPRSQLKTLEELGSRAIALFLSLPFISVVHALFLGMAINIGRGDRPPRRFAFLQRWKASLVVNLIVLAVGTLVGVVRVFTGAPIFESAFESYLVIPILGLLLGGVAAYRVFPRLLSAPGIPPLARLESFWLYIWASLLNVLVLGGISISLAILIPLIFGS